MACDLTRFDLADMLNEVSDSETAAGDPALTPVPTKAHERNSENVAVCTLFACSPHRNDNWRLDSRARFFLTPGTGREKETMLINGTRSKVAVLAVAVIAVAGCSKKENYGADTTAAASSTVTGDTSTTAAAPAPSGTWTDPNIFALLDEANMADSSAGSIAQTKGTASAVRNFGRDMMRDHHTLRTQGAALAKKLNITPAAPSNDPVMPMAQDETNTLNTTAKGKDFDKAYIDAEVNAHKAVLDLATKAAGQTQNAELKNLIQKAAPVLQGHLTRAESIQKTLK
jgi:putative membrane protein